MDDEADRRILDRYGKYQNSEPQPQPMSFLMRLISMGRSEEPIPDEMPEKPEEPKIRIKIDSKGIRIDRGSTAQKVDDYVFELMENGTLLEQEKIPEGEGAERVICYSEVYKS